MKYVVSIDDPTCLDQPIGGKARALARLSFEDFPVPSAFVVLPVSMKVSLGPEGLERLRSVADHEEAAALLDPLTVRADVCSQVLQMIEARPADRLWAVRSSASDEDGVDHSFAGQLDSFLNIPAEKLVEAVRSVWLSGFSERIFIYRRGAGLDLPPPIPAVLVQQMVNADSAGVAFSSDPVSGNYAVSVVAAVRGLGEKLVSGEANSDTFQVDRNGGVIQRSLADGPESQPAITDQEAASIAELSRHCAAFFGCPQDIEWALHEKVLYLLQSRPITSLKGKLDAGGACNLWDNSNIAESYSGVTTPLTFSFASMVYEQVYRQFVRILKVPESKILDNRETFSRMLGLIRGRVYYNLLSWYQVLAMLPGFSINRAFMEQMMGVKSALPEEQIEQIIKANHTAPWRDGMALTAALWGLLLNHALLQRKISSFYRQLDQSLAAPHPPLAQLRADELASAYHRLEKELLTRWDAPLVNDFFAMIYYGLSRKVVSQWIGDDAEGLQNDLIACQGGIISAEPAQRIRRMADYASQDVELISLLESGTETEIRQALPSHPDLEHDLSSYLDKFGDRCLEELKLESATLHDCPLPLLRSIGHFARRQRENPISNREGTSRLLSEAERRCQHKLAGHPVRQLIFRWVINQTRNRVRDRENLRFERTRVFGRVRRIFVEIGKRFQVAGVMDEPRDIFYLSVGEVMDFIEGKAVSVELKQIVAIRKREFRAYENEEAPSDRFSTQGMVYVGNCFQAPMEISAQEPEGDVLTGLACCPGRVEGPARVITDPRGAELKSGEILVAPRTDPGWIMLFPSASALVVEYGSLLSHSAIVAREMGIPAVVSVQGATKRIRTGDRIRVDGSRGQVSLLNRKEDA